MAVATEKIIPGVMPSNLILVGINYDRSAKNDSVEFKHHSCEIEKV